MVKLAEFTESKIVKILYDIRVAIHTVGLQYLSEQGMRIQMPKYFIELLQYHNERFVPGFTCSDKELKCFGATVQPSFDNFIVVFHEDMPLYQNTAYQVIDLK